MDSPFGGQCGDQRFVAIGGVGNSCWKTIPRCNGYPCGFMALIETVPASIRNASHSRSWSRNWYSAGAMITMGRGGSLMNAAGHDQRTRKSSPAQMASSIAPWQGQALQASILARRKVLGARDRQSGRAAQPGRISPRTPIDFETPIWLKTNLQEPEWSGVGCVLRDDRSGFHQGAMPMHRCEQSLIVQPADCLQPPAPQQWRRDRH